MPDPQPNDLLSRLEKLEKSKRFWKRLALGQLVGLVLLLVLLVGSSLYMLGRQRQMLERALQAQMEAEENHLLADEIRRKAQDAEHRRSVEDLGGKHQGAPKEK